MELLRRRRRWLGGAIVAAVVLGWWWWPSIVDEGPTNDVLIVADGDLIESATPVGRRIRERGFSVVEEHSLTSWCEAAAALPDLIESINPSTVIISFRTAGDCPNSVEQSIAAIGERRAVLVIQPGAGRQEQALGAAIGSARDQNVLVADPSAFLGDVEMPSDVGCLWWDDCSPDGSVEIRDASGALTPAGGERVARVIVSSL
jgi:hypothetical protein